MAGLEGSEVVNEFVNILSPLCFVLLILYPLHRSLIINDEDMSFDVQSFESDMTTQQTKLLE